MRWFDKIFSPSPERPNTALDLACAVLLIEILKADHHIDEREQAQLKSILQSLFHLNEADSQSLISEAFAQSEAATDLFKYTEAINAQWHAADKYQLIRSLWQVAYSDAALDKYEEYMIRRISDLLYVPHSEFIRAKLSVTAHDS